MTGRTPQEVAQLTPVQTFLIANPDYATKFGEQERIKRAIGKMEREKAERR